MAVIVSLAYLALQVGQNTQSLRTENYARALDRIAAVQSQLSRDTEFTRFFSKGVADVSLLTPTERIQSWWLSFPGVRSWWHHRPVPFSASFSSFVEDILRESAADEAAARRWQEFVAGGRTPLAGVAPADRPGAADDVAR